MHGMVLQQPLTESKLERMPHIDSGMTYVFANFTEGNGTRKPQAGS